MKAVTPCRAWRDSISFKHALRAAGAVLAAANGLVAEDALVGTAAAGEQGGEALSREEGVAVARHGHEVPGREGERFGVFDGGRLASLGLGDEAGEVGVGVSGQKRFGEFGEDLLGFAAEAEVELGALLEYPAADGAGVGAAEHEPAGVGAQAPGELISRAGEGGGGCDAYESRA